MRADQHKRTSKVYTFIGNGSGMNVRSSKLKFLKKLVLFYSWCWFGWFVFSVADTLLWKDKKQTLTTVLFLAAIYYYFFASGYTLIAAMAKLLSLSALFLFVNGMLPTTMYGFNLLLIKPMFQWFWSHLLFILPKFTKMSLLMYAIFLPFLSKRARSSSCLSYLKWWPPLFPFVQPWNLT